ncbi:plancitoxin-1 isoform X2 [Topomyia yanbarensis]|uniref:plancitoxin-1 isoform X2 n=1 Tax=Topomyia yanbarensis TaxID=2498891 RepID=UPI00273C4A1D|nr:plancitoxin-1 isoform X2 [Topomyia yanbarensis]
MRMLLLLLLTVLFQGGLFELGCRDEENNLVDWYYLYKLPHEYFDRNTTSSGFRYAFMTSAGSGKWQLSERTVNDSASIPGRTLQPVLDESGSSSLALLYNDEPPENSTDGLRGHTKGVVATDGTSGFWLVHSVPKYPPPLGQSYQYPSSGKLFGQSYLCISVAADQMELIGMQLLLNEPHVYSFRIPEELQDRFPRLVKVTQMETDESPPYWKVLDLTSRGGTTFHSFAKNRFFKKELYADFIAPALQVGLQVETWQHGAGNLPSECSHWPVFNVKDVKVTEDYHFSTLKDHSKWAVSSNSDKEYICVGDINRQEHQKERGGGSVCSQLSSVVAVYRASVTSIENCTQEESNKCVPLYANDVRKYKPTTFLDISHANRHFVVMAEMKL